MGACKICQEGGGQLFLSIWASCVPRSAVRCHALAMGVRGYAPPRKDFKLCNLVRFGVYFDKILTKIYLKKYSFFIQK